MKAKIMLSAILFSMFLCPTPTTANNTSHVSWAAFEERIACQDYLKYWVVGNKIVFEDETTFVRYVKEAQEERDCGFRRNFYYQKVLDKNKIPVPRQGGFYKAHDGYGIMVKSTIMCGPKNKLKDGDQFKVDDYALYLFELVKCKRVLAGEEE